MNAETVKLTTYFGEAARSDGELLADALMQLYQQRQVRASVMIRGIEGFGASHRDHTDLLLTLSQDLPVVTVAVDTAEQIDRLLPDVLTIRRKGLVTVERARLISGAETLSNGGRNDDRPPEELPDDLRDAAKLSVYVGRHQRAGSTPAFVAVCDVLQGCGMYGASVLLGVDGTSAGRRARAQLIGRNADVPMLVMSVGPGEAVRQALAQVRELLPRAAITLERVSVTRRDGVWISDPQPGPPILVSGPQSASGTGSGNGGDHGLGGGHGHKLTVYTSDDDRWRDRPLHREIIRRLRARQLAGATSMRGIWGFHDDAPPRGDRLLQARRHSPVITIAIDTPERIAAAYAEIEELTAQSGLVTVETVPILGLALT